MASTTHNPRLKDGDKSHEVMGKAKEIGGQVVDKAKEVGAQAVDKAKETGAQVAEKAKEAAASVGGMAGQAVSAVGKKADDLTAGAGSDIKHWGEALSKNSPREGVMGQASQAVADTLKESGHYLEEAKLSGMADDVVTLIKRNPVPAVLLGVGIGFILGRALRS